MDRKIYLSKQIVRKLREAEVIICLLRSFHVQWQYRMWNKSFMYRKQTV